MTASANHYVIDVGTPRGRRLDGEQPAQERVEQSLKDRPLISWVNAIDVYYRVERDHGRTEADHVLAGMRKVLELDLPGTALMIETARLRRRCRSRWATASPSQPPAAMA
jgi:hypothetical protein